MAFLGMKSASASLVGSSQATAQRPIEAGGCSGPVLASFVSISGEVK